MKVKKILCAMAAFSLCVAMAAVSVSAEGDVEINETNFPEKIFRIYVKQFDKDYSGSLSREELDAVYYIDVSNKEITDLKGIEYFKKLSQLECDNNQLRKLDVSNNTSLSTLKCHSNLLKSLDISSNTALISLNCNNNELTSLDVSNNTALRKLDCLRNKLTNIDISKNTALIEIWCDSNQLTSLDVSNNTALDFLNCGGNQLTSLDVSNNTALTELRCYDNQLTSLDISNNTALDTLICGGNPLTSLDVSNNTALTELWCDSNQLTSLDVRNNTNLVWLNCDFNSLTSLDLSQNTALRRLYCYGCDLTSLDLSHNTALDDLECSDNQLTTLDLSYNTALSSLMCNGNHLTSLDLSNNNLQYFNCFRNSYSVKVTDGSFSLNALPAGFDPSKASEWNGAEYDSSTNSLKNFTSDTVTYKYSCGQTSDGYIFKAECSLEIKGLDPVADFVERLYTMLLDRSFDNTGKANWVNDLHNGVSAAKVASGFVLSKELALQNLSNTEFVTRMYRTFMDREPDESGLADWVDALDNGCSYAFVLNSFVLSEEFGNICKGYGIETGRYELTEPRDKSRNLTAFTSRMYTMALGRKYEVAGLNDWTGRYINGEISLNDMAYGFIFSEEFTNKNLSNEEYVDTLYATFFDRLPDADGRADWLGQLNAGSSREHVLNGFLGAKEFADLVDSFGLDK